MSGTQTKRTILPEFTIRHYAGHVVLADNTKGTQVILKQPGQSQPNGGQLTLKRIGLPAANPL